MYPIVSLYDIEIHFDKHKEHVNTIDDRFRRPNGRMSLSLERKSGDINKRRLSVSQ